MPVTGDRSRSPKENEANKAASGSDFDAAFMAAFERNAKTINNAVSQGVSASIQEPIRDTVLQVCKEQFSAFDGRLQSLEDGQVRMSSDITDIKKTLEKMALGRSISTPDLFQSQGVPSASGIDFVETPEPTPTFTATPLTGFERVINPTVLYITTFNNTDVEKSQIVLAFTKLAEEANIVSDRFNISGDPLD